MKKWDKRGRCCGLGRVLPLFAICGDAFSKTGMGDKLMIGKRMRWIYTFQV